MGFNWCSDPTLVFVFKWKFFWISKKITSVGSSTFQKNLRLDQPTLVIFLAFEKNYNNWIKSFSKSKRTGLLSSDILQLCTLLISTTDFWLETSKVLLYPNLNSRHSRKKEIFLSFKFLGPESQGGYWSNKVICAIKSC